MQNRFDQRVLIEFSVSNGNRIIIQVGAQSTTDIKIIIATNRTTKQNVTLQNDTYFVKLFNINIKCFSFIKEDRENTTKMFLVITLDRFMNNVLITCFYYNKLTWDDHEISVLRN